MTLNEIVELINKPEKRVKDKRRNLWHGVYIGMSLHIDGVCPSFVNGDNKVIYPYGWCNADYDDYFDTHLLNRFPTEQPWIRNWRKSVYRPLTRAPFLQVISVLTGAIFQDSAYTLIIPNKKDSDYIWGNTFDNKDLIQYIVSKFQEIAEDPNGYFVVIPKEKATETTTENVEPYLSFIFSDSIIHASKEELVFKQDDIVWVMTREAIYRYYKPEKSAEYVNMDAEGFYYTHKLGHVPAYVAGGMWNSKGYYDSWFVNAKPLADEFVSSYSSVQFINKDATHPYVVEADASCPECNGVPQIQYCKKCDLNSEGCVCGTSEQWYLKKCAKCNGSGKVARNPGDRMIVPADMMGNNLIQIINRDVAANKYLSDFQADLYNQILRSLYLNYIEQAQSGVAKDKDMEARYQFLSKVAGDLFDRLLYGIVGDILGYRNIRVVNGENMPDNTGFTITKPTQFNIQTAADLLEEYKTANESKMPPYQRAAILEKYNNKQFSGDEVLNKKAYIINELDVLNVLTEVEIQAALLNGGASQRDYQYHLQLPKIINRLVRERGRDWFLNSTFDVIEAEILTVFNSILPPPIPIVQNEP